MKQECKDCNKSLDDCTCIEDTIELPNQALIDAAERYIAGDNYNRYYDDFIEGAKWQIGKQDNFAVGFAEWSVARALGCNTFTINQDELNIYKKYIDKLNGN